jgi:LacI family transcriptional regulator
LKIKLTDIAKKSGVSIGTVDRVLHNRGEVSEKTRLKVLDIIKELNYSPDLLARTLALKKNLKVGLLLPKSTPTMEYWDLPKKGIAKALDELGHFGISTKEYYFDCYDSTSFLEKSEKLLSEPVDAVVLAPMLKKVSIEFCRNCSKKNIPVVLLDSQLENIETLSYIGHNSWFGGQVAAHLLSMALLENDEILIAVIAHQHEDLLPFQDRIRGFNNFFANRPGKRTSIIHEVKIHDSPLKTVFAELDKCIGPKTKGVFVPNSRVYMVADYLVKNKLGNIVLIGYDLIEKNILHLKENNISFLISQGSEEQGYKAILTIVNSLLLKKQQPQFQYLPIDILTKENIEFYLSK